MTCTRPMIYLVDDDESVLKALGRLVSAAGYEFQSFASAAEFLDRHDPDRHGCVVLDLRMEGTDGLAVQQSLSTGPIDRPIVFLTGNGDVPSSVRAMKDGAVDFLVKPVEAPALLSAIGIALERDRSARRDGERRKAVDGNLARLTPREHEVLACIVAGQLNKQIAAELGVAEKTVKVHRARVMRKMEVHTVADLVRTVARHST